MLDERGARALAQAVIIQAAWDAANGDAKAAAWLLDLDTADTWGELAGVNWQVVTAWIKRGCKLRRGSKNKRAVIYFPCPGS